MNELNIQDAAVYCGTYGKYNDGSIAGKWLKLSEYQDKDEFIKACLELHSDEDDPELMFQDWEHIPDGMVGESFIDEQVWELLSMDDDDIELLMAWRDYGNGTDDLDDDLESAKDGFIGKFDSDVDFAMSLFDCSDNIPDYIMQYFDWDSYARDLMYNYFSVNGLYFIA